MGGNPRLCSNMQKDTPYRGGKQNASSENEWAVGRDMENQKVHQPKGQGRIVFIARQAVLQF